MLEKTSQNRRSGSPQVLLWVMLQAIALTVLFWLPLWTGGGLIGGDTYTYFFPQKTFYANHLSDNELPLWNNLAGHGYPLVAESQTGFCYPTTYPLYRWLNVNTAYNVNLIVHYVLCFIFTWMYARRINLSHFGATMAAIVFTYGWFPPRVHWEWSYVTGTWLPLSFWLMESYLQSHRWRYLMLLSMALAMQMLGGHFYIAFYTQIALVFYVALRLWFRSGVSEQREKTRTRTAILLGLAISFSFLLAAVQLLPTWELKQESQRHGLPIPNFEYGYIPPAYLSQLIAPWYCYATDFSKEWVKEGHPQTNVVEAHLYLGLAPICLIFCGFLTRKGPFQKNRLLIPLILLGSVALIVTTGWLTPVLKYIPGFGYFSNSARYGILVTLAGAMLAGATYQDIAARLVGATRVAWIASLLLLTVSDLYVVSRTVTFASLLANAPVEFRSKSNLDRFAQEQPQPVRVFAPGQNLLTIFGVAVTPTFLGLSPRAYVAEETSMPQPFPFDQPPMPDQIDWLQRAGVTHILSFQPLDRKLWPVIPIIERAHDPILNTVFARPEGFFFYELQSTRGRISWQSPREGASAQIVTYHPNHVVIKAVSPDGGRLILTDLMYPGWNVRVDDCLAHPVIVDGMYRSVDVPRGEHVITWDYDPASLRWGTRISLLALVCWCFAALVLARMRRSRPIRSQA